MVTERKPLATTFRIDEVKALCAVFRKLNCGGDISVMLRNKALRTSVEKFFRLEQKAERLEIERLVRDQ